MGKGNLSVGEETVAEEEEIKVRKKRGKRENDKVRRETGVEGAGGGRLCWLGAPGAVGGSVQSLPLLTASRKTLTVSESTNCRCASLPS